MSAKSAGALALLAIELACAHNKSPVANSLPVHASDIPITLPAGTTLALRMVESCDSLGSAPGRTCAAVISRGVSDSRGRTLLDDGSPATLVLLRTQSSAGPGFRLGIASVTLNGNAYLLRRVTDEENPAASAPPLGMYLGAARGVEPPSSAFAERRELPPIVPSGPRVQVPAGALLTFRLIEPLRLVGS